MPNNVYIGSRYVPIFDGAWNNTKTYEPLTIVEYGNSSYTSKKSVPAGTLPTNTSYWALTGNYNGQISNLQTQIDAIKSVTNAKTNPKYLTVGSSGCNYTTITDAINAAKTYSNSVGGVTIFVIGGDYNESIDLNGNYNINLIGISRPTIRTSASYPNAAIKFTGSIRIEGFQLLNTSSNGNSYAIHYEAQDQPSAVNNNVVIRDCDISSWDNSAIGFGLNSGDNVEFYNCRFTCWGSNPAVRFHPYPSATTNEATICFFGCWFDCASSANAIDVANSRAMQGNSGSSNMTVRFIDCTASAGHVGILYHTTSSASQGYVPQSGEIHLDRVSMNNNIIGANYDEAAAIDKVYRITFPTTYDWTDGTYKRYSAGVDIPYDKYDVSLVAAATNDSTNFLSNAQMYTNVNGSIGIVALDYGADVLKPHLMTGACVTIRFTPKKYT